MQRLRGSDAIFLYRETPTSLMHTLKVLLLSKVEADAGYDRVYQRIKQQLGGNDVVRQRILPVPLGLHHPVMIAMLNASYTPPSLGLCTGY